LQRTPRLWNVVVGGEGKNTRIIALVNYEQRGYPSILLLPGGRRLYCENDGKAWGDNDRDREHQQEKEKKRIMLLALPIVVATSDLPLVVIGGIQLAAT